MLRALPTQLAIAGLIIALAQPAGRTVRETPIQILEHGQETMQAREAFSAQSDWPEEVIANRIETTLEEFVNSASASVASFVSTEFRGAALGPRELIRTGNSEIRNYRGCLSSERAVSHQAFPVEIRALLDGYHSVRTVSFRVTKIDVEPGNRKVQATVNYSITGITDNLGPRQDQGVWQTEWIGGDAGWRLIGLDCIDSSRQESRSLFFHDLSANALANNTSLLQQLNRGIGYWAERVDAGSQIDLYGLNGIAVGDYDGDGWEDVYVCQPGGLPNRLLRNRGDGTFEDVTAQAGLAVMDSTSAAVWADYDNDGDQDLFVITPSAILLFENDGHGRFQRSRKAQFDIPPEQRGVLMMAAMADYDRDGFLDLFVCQYSPAGGSSMAKYLAQPTPYHDANNGPPNQLFHNNGDATFTNVTRKAGLANTDRWSLAAAWGDYNQDGYPDLYVANDFGGNNLYRNNGDGTFTDVAAQAGVEDVGAGMSVAWGDYESDGVPCLVFGLIRAELLGNRNMEHEQELTIQFRRLQPDCGVSEPFVNKPGTQLVQLIPTRLEHDRLIDPRMNERAPSLLSEPMSPENCGLRRTG